MAPPDAVIYDHADGYERVATITLNRPESMNALDHGAKRALKDAIDRAAGDDGVRSVLLTGSGRAFCAGQDLREHGRNLDSGRALEDTVRHHYNPIVRALTEMPKPVVAAVNGMAAGAGACLAFACDLRIASDTAAFSLAFTGIGLTADTGGSWLLPRLVGRGRALELLLLGERVDAVGAREIGLVSEVVPAAELPERALALAGRLAEGPTVAYGCIKRAVSYGADHGLPETLELEAELQERCAATADHRAATAAFLAKRKPTFEGR